MPHGQVLEFARVTKRFNEVTAVSDFSARIEPGVVTAFLGPNGAGKTTTLRILLGQVRATSGTATIGGVAYPELRHPLRTIGAVLEETVYRPRRSATRHLTIAAKANGIPLSRVDEVLSLVGLESEAEGRIGSFSLGMRQRLSVAHALLGDPGALVFDEPANGLDPEGIRWMRLLMRRLADEGRTVLVSSHVLSEVEQVADHVLVLSKGRLMLSSGIETLADPTAGSVVVDAVDRAGLRTALADAGFEVEVLRSGLTVRGGDTGTVGAIAAASGIALSTLVQRGPTLEDIFIDLVRGGRFDAQLAAAPAISATPAAAPDAVPAIDADPALVPALPLAGAGAVASADALLTDAGADAAPEAPTSLDGTLAGDAEDLEPADEVSSPADDAPQEDAPAPADTEQADDAQADAVTADGGTPAAEWSDDLAETTVLEHAALDEAAADDETTVIDTAAIDDALHTDDADADSRSFDDILFGAPVTEPVDLLRTAETPVLDDTAAHSGVDIFASLTDSHDDAAGEQSEPEDAALSESEDQSEPEAQSETADTVEGDETPSEIADPRAIAVSTMLRAAARAYYEDAPRDYPGASTEAADESESEQRPLWAVASTGVIDVVPTTAPTEESPADEASASDGEHEHHEHDGHEHHENEHHSDEHHEHHNG